MATRKEVGNILMSKSRQLIALRIGNIPISKLRQLVALPQAHETGLINLPQAVKCYFDEALAFIDIISELVLQRINSPNPIKQLSIIVFMNF